jgi:xanthine dehydrogenase iron-sulfur cluster and FAD-binding subunit A
MRQNPMQVLGHERYSRVNACLLPLGTLHGAAVTTTEGLGNSQDGFHPVRSRAA